MNASKATVEAPSNIALIKYWGAKDIDRAIPAAPSLSMTLRTCCTRTTVAFREGETGDDTVFVADDAGTLHPADDAFAAPVVRHLGRLRDAFDRRGTFRVATRNHFPSAAGIASSASGFAALTMAATRALGLDLGPSALSVWARRSGSGSAARSVFGGYVGWPRGDDAAAEPVLPHTHWDLRDVIAVVDATPKAVSSREGHRRAPSSPFFETRLDHLSDRLDVVRDALEARDLGTLGEAVEREAVELHLIAMSSRPPIFYWTPATLAVLEAVRTLRTSGVAAYATMDAGANVHVLCAASDEPEVARRLESMSEVQQVLRDGVGAGPTHDVEPLF